MKKLATVLTLLLSFVYAASVNATTSISEIQSWTLVKDEGKVLEFSTNNKNRQLWIWMPRYEDAQPPRKQMVSDQGSDVQEWELIETIRVGSVLHMGLDRTGPIFGAWYQEVSKKTVTKTKNGKMVSEDTYEPIKGQKVFILRHPDGRETQGSGLSIGDVKDQNGTFVDFELQLKIDSGVVRELWSGYFGKR